MVLSTGTNKIKTAIFISGTGSNLKSLIKFSKLKKSPISINLIITNNKLAKGLRYGGIFQIKKKIINFKNKEIAEKKILNDLEKNKIELICLAGFMKILSGNFIKNFKGKILNIHFDDMAEYRLERLIDLEEKSFEAWKDRTEDDSLYLNKVRANILSCVGTKKAMVKISKNIC